MDLQRLEDRLRRALFAEDSANRGYDRDTADDGFEVNIIRQELDRSWRWYDHAVQAAIRKEIEEDARIIAAEALFCRKVGL